MGKDDIARRIKEARIKAGKTQLDAAQHLGVSYQAISNYERAKTRIETASLASLCSLYGVSLDSIVKDAPYDDANRSLSKSDSHIFSIRGINRPAKTYQVPRLGTIACGEPILAVQNFDGYDDAPENVHCDFTLVCKGDSMINAHIMDGSVVYVRQQEDVENGEIAAVLIDDEATLKRVYKKPGQLILMPENSEYEPQMFTRENMSDVRILGKAVAFLSIVK